MNILSITIALSIVGVMSLPAQTANGQANIPEPTAYAITTRDGNSQVWQRTTYEADPAGKVISHIHKYTELATGLNHLVAGQWVASDETITILPDGTAAATNGQHQAYFPSDIYNGEIKLVTPDGKVLQSQPMGLSYDDGSNTVWIAILTNSIGQLVSSNQIVYPNAFVGLNADLRYTYRKSGFEQDVILHEQPPAPASLGLNPDTTRIQVVTEFFDSPTPMIKTIRLQTTAGELQNDELTFGTMQMTQGKAFSMGTNSSSVPVNKQWMQMSGRQFLVEEVQTAAMADDLENLPAPVYQTRIATPLHVASAHLTLTAQHLAKTTLIPQGRAIQLTQAALPTRGLVLDYQIVNSSLTNFIFQGDATYYISSAVNLFGTNAFEGGAVLKYTNGASIGIQYPATIKMLSTTYRPTIFTAKDDNSIGEAIGGSTGTPTNYYANPAISYAGNYSGLSYLTLNNFRISYAQEAIYVTGASIDVTLADGQIIKCVTGLSTPGRGGVYLYNMLFAKFSYAMALAYVDVYFQNVTFGGNVPGTGYVPSFIYYLTGSGSSVAVNFVNCILANSGLNYGSPTTNITGSYNGFYSSPTFGSSPISSSYPFQTVGGGSYYLTNNCILHNAGTTNVDPTLLADLDSKTTYPPLIYSNVTLSSATTLSPQAQRDDTGIPDLGYHYDPVDYFVDMFAVTNALLTINAGTVIAADNSVAGIWLTGSSSIISIGTPLTPNWFVHYSCVQEQSVAIGTNGSSGFYNGLFINTWSSSQTQNGVFRFTKFAIPAGSSSYYFYDSGNWNYQSLLVQDCELWNSQNELDGEASGAATSATFNNNLFSESDIAIETLSSTNYFLSFTNNLFLNASIGVYSSSNVCAFFNNDFDTCTLSVGNVRNPTTIANGYDAYINCNQQLNPTNAYDLVLTNALAYETSWFGSYYQPTNSLLIKKGSTTADQVGLYHFTTQTNQVPETNSVVDIGYHYVATDAYGNPLDTNGDGIPDYLEDANGNGLVDSGEIGWNIVGDLGLQVIISQPRSGSTIP